MDDFLKIRKAIRRIKQKGDYNMEKVEVGEIFTMVDDENEEHVVEVVAKINKNENEYVAVIFCEEIQEDSNDDIDVFFLKVEDNGEFLEIENDEEFESVSSAFDEMMEEEEEEQQ